MSWPGATGAAFAGTHSSRAGLRRKGVDDGLESIRDLATQGADDPDDDRRDESHEQAVLDRSGTFVVTAVGTVGEQCVKHNNGVKYVDKSPHDVPVAECGW